MKTLFRSYLGFALVVFAITRFAAAAMADDDKVLFESLKLGDSVVKNVRVKNVTPTHVTLHYDGGGSQIKREDLPPELKKLYPYDPKEAAVYEKKLTAERDKHAKEARERQQQLSEELKASLQKQELKIQARLTELQREMEKLNREMGPMRAKAQGKKHSAARQDLDAARDKKRELIKRIDEQKDMLAKVRKQLN
jgi:hypothetical protein